MATMNNILNSEIKLIRQSNAWYNDGLAKAQLNDLAGAILSLKESLRHYSANIEARNLLGLCYYGRGEVAEALVEWIISKNFAANHNLANYYLETIQSAATQLEEMNRGIKAYNEAYHQAAHGDIDMAIVRLKAALKGNRRFVKGWQLLALLYMERGQATAARQALGQARQIDRGDTHTVRLHELLSGLQPSSRRNLLRRRESPATQKKATRLRKSGGRKKEGQRIALSEYREVFRFANLALGVLIGAMFIWFIMVPAVNHSSNQANNDQILAFSERIQSLEAQISAQTRTLDEYRGMDGEVEGLREQALQTSSSYDQLLNVQAQRASGEFTVNTMAQNLLEINREMLGNSGQALFDELAGIIFPQAIDASYSTGLEAFQVGNWIGAIENFRRVISLSERHDEGNALLRLAQAYQRHGEYEDAAVMFQRVVDLFPGSERADVAQAELDLLLAEPEEEPVPENGYDEEPIDGEEEV